MASRLFSSSGVCQTGAHRVEQVTCGGPLKAGLSAVAAPGDLEWHFTLAATGVPDDDVSGSGAALREVAGSPGRTETLVRGHDLV
jgi:hypothetical protein